LKPSDSEGETTRAREKPSSKRTEPKAAARVKRGIVISDDEDEEVPRPPPPPRPKATYKTKAKAATPDSEAEKELRAMMDIDDGKKRSPVLYLWTKES
jgi:DNA polymerase delta subunit 3